MFTHVLNDLKSILEEKQISIITEINTIKKYNLLR